MKIGIIGGSGLYSIDGFESAGEVEQKNIYGTPSSPYKIFRQGEVEFYFLSRHGHLHNIAPHKVNYRANIYGFKELGVEQIISFTATGGISENLKPSDIVIPNNAIDMTSGRVSTFFDENEIVHIDFTNPFCHDLRGQLIKMSFEAGVPIVKNGVYLCTNGPRLETASEIKMFKSFGADIVGMTLFPEAVLAREAEVCYCNISIVTNFAAGISKTKLTTDEVVENVKNAEVKLKQILTAYGKNPCVTGTCGCKSALTNSRISKIGLAKNDSA